MSLSRDEWAKMWEAIKTIERYMERTTGTDHKYTYKMVLFIKQKIQSVVGQME